MAPIEARALGSQGLRVGAIGLGAMGMSSFYTKGKADDEESIRVLRRAAELGCTMIDTSNVYGFGANERLIANVLKGNERDKYVVATKFGYYLKPDKTIGVRGDAEHIREACEQSLKDLGIHQIDLLYQHQPDKSVPIEDSVRGMAAMVKEGKVKYLGLSGDLTPDQIRAAHAVHSITAVQLGWSLWEREAEKQLIPVCRELGIGIVCFSPLGRGFLTGQITSPDDIPDDDFRKRLPRYHPDNFYKNFELVDKVKAIAKRQNATPGQVALAWLLAQGPDVVPIPGTKAVKRLEENAAAASVSLSTEDLQDLEKAFPHDVAVGGRKPEDWKH